jgi:hypothetical protein
LGVAQALGAAVMRMMVTHWLGEYFAWLMLAIFAGFLVLLTVASLMFFIVFLYGLCNTLLNDSLGK